ncbi:MAG TPA: hypothetical protein VIV11_43295 [Kofleriaceae bacterium]
MSSPAAPVEPLQFGAPPAVVAKPATPVRLWNARPGVPLARVFATEDGSAAVSIDESNHARLWPSLDGKREPYVLPLTTPVEAVINRDGDGYSIAALDESGGFEVIVVSADGVMTSHVRREPEPGVEIAVSRGDGFLVLHRDQTLEHLDKRGARIGSLLPQPGSHVVKLLHRNGRTLALVRKRDGLRGQWIATDTLAWGDESPKLRVDLSKVFLSPDHKRLATLETLPDALLDRSGAQVLLVDLDTGAAKPLLNKLSMNGPMGVPIGFAADQRVIIAFSDFELSTVEWWKPSGHSNAVIGGMNYHLEFVAVDQAVVTDTNVIAFAEHDLAVMRPNTATAPSELRYLGYRITRTRGIKPTPAGVVATIGGSAYLLDDNARVAKRVPTLETIPFGKDLALIKFTARDWGEPVIGVSNFIDPEWIEGSKIKRKSQDSTPRIALFDLATKKELQRWPTARRIYFEPTSQLMAIDRGTKAFFARFDATTRKFGDEHTIASGGSEIVLLDPALAGGNVAMLVRQRGKTIEVRTLRDLAAEPPAPTTLTGTLEATDRAGRLYVRDDTDTVVVYGGKEPVRLTGLTKWRVRPHPNGTQVAAFARSRLMLLGERGDDKWAVGFPGISDVAWSPDGALVALSGDLAKLDAATGRVVAAQCGWSFGLRISAREPSDFPSTNETLCDH